MPLRDTPIRRKLMTVILATSGAVMLLTSVAFFAYEYVTYRQTAARQAYTLGQIIATNSSAAVAFSDREAAGEILSALRAEREVQAACLYDASGNVFAYFPATADTTSFPRMREMSSFEFVNAHLEGFIPVTEGGSRLGSLYLRMGMGAMYARLRLYALIALLIVGLSILLAYILSRSLQRQISMPILALAGTAQAVSDRRDYSVRAEKLGDDEVGRLTEAFNHMLTRIQEQVARLGLLNRVTHAIGERQHLESILSVVVGTLEEHLPVDFALVFKHDVERDELSVESVGERSRERATRLGLPEGSTVPIGSNGILRCLRGELIYEPDTSQVDSGFTNLFASDGLHSLVMAPLRVESNAFGVLVAAREDASAFSSPDCEFLKQLSEHVALATHQAQLYEALQQAYEELRQTQQTALQQERLRALGQMASGVAHDINNAISPVALYTESLLESETDLSPRAREYLETIQHAVEDVASTVARVREFYRQREERAALVPVDLNVVVRHVLDLTRARWSDMPQERGVVIETLVDPEADLPPILGVDTEIREALTNLVFNAVDAMPDGGRLTLRTRSMPGKPMARGAAHGPHVRVEVIDTGIGMDEDTRRRSMEPFYTTKGDRGTGLGLATVYGMAQRHGADLEIESAPGRGTTMRLSFPASPEAEAGQLHRETMSPLPRRLHILVIDDDPLLLKSLRDTLESEGHSVVTASSGQAGLDSFHEAMENADPFSVVITDLGMPYMDGRQVANAIKSASGSTPIIMLTGWGRRLIDDGETLEDVDHLLSKPPKLKELRETLAACCGKRNHD